MKRFRLRAAAPHVTLTALAAALLSPALGTTANAAPKSVQRMLVTDGTTRTYQFYRPASIAANASPPLVVVLHGGFGTGAGAEEHYHWDAAADAGNFLVVAPDGVNKGWNWGGCCGHGQTPGDPDPIDDVKFLTALVGEIERTEHADPKRIFFTGMSAGANMSFRMACQAPIAIAAVAPVAGTVDTACDHPQKTSVLQIGGTADTQIPIAGGRSTGPYVRDILPSIASVLDKWRALDACAAPVTTNAPPVTTILSACAQGRQVEEIIVDGAGHQWPGADPPSPEAIAIIRKAGSNLAMPSTAIDATSTIWKFFSDKRSP